MSLYNATWSSIFNQASAAMPTGEPIDRSIEHHLVGGEALGRFHRSLVSAILASDVASGLLGNPCLNVLPPASRPTFPMPLRPPST